MSLTSFTSAKFENNSDDKTFKKFILERLKKHNTSCIIAAILVILALSIQIHFIVKPAKVTLTEDYCDGYHEPKRKVLRVLTAVVIWFTTYADFLMVWCFEAQEGKYLEKREYDFESPMVSYLKGSFCFDKSGELFKKLSESKIGNILSKPFKFILMALFSMSLSSLFGIIKHFSDLPYIDFNLFVECGWKDLFDPDNNEPCHDDAKQELGDARKVIKPAYFYVIICLTELFATSTLFYFTVAKVHEMSKKRRNQDSIINAKHRITFLEFGFCKAAILALTEIPILMLLEFFTYELLLTDHHGEYFGKTEWTAINNLIMVFGLIFYGVYAVEYFLINTHKQLKTKSNEIKRDNLLGRIDDEISFYHLWVFLGSFFCLLVASCVRILITNVVGTRYVLTEKLNKNGGEEITETQIIELMKINSTKENSCSMFNYNTYQNNLPKIEERFSSIVSLQSLFSICCLIPLVNFILFFVIEILSTYDFTIKIFHDFTMKSKNFKIATNVSKMKKYGFKFKKSTNGTAATVCILLLYILPVMIAFFFAVTPKIQCDLLKNWEVVKYCGECVSNKTDFTCTVKPDKNDDGRSKQSTAASYEQNKLFMQILMNKKELIIKSKKTVAEYAETIKSKNYVQSARGRGQWTESEDEAGKDSIYQSIIVQSSQDSSTLESGHFLMDQLLKTKFDVDPFLYAAAMNDLPMIKRMVNINDYDDEFLFETKTISDNFGQNALHYASEFGGLETVKFLVEHRIIAPEDTDNTKGFRKNSFMKAVMGRKFEIMKYLNKINSSLKENGDKGENALTLASQFTDLETVKFLVEDSDMKMSVKEFGKSEESNSFIRAAFNGNIDILEYLNDQDPELKKSVDSNGDTALIMAAEFADLDTVKFLVEDIKVDIRETGFLNSNCFLRAASNGKIDTLRYLNQKDGKLNTLRPITDFIRNRNFKILKMARNFEDESPCS